MKFARLAPLALLPVLLAACSGGSSGTPSVAQENQACHDVGLTPGTRQYQTCVGNLDAAMLEYANPAAR